MNSQVIYSSREIQTNLAVMAYLQMSHLACYKKTYRSNLEYNHDLLFFTIHLGKIDNTRWVIDTFTIIYKDNYLIFSNIKTFNHIILLEKIVTKDFPTGIEKELDEISKNDKLTISRLGVLDR